MGIAYLVDEQAAFNLFLTLAIEQFDPVACGGEDGRVGRKHDQALQLFELEHCEPARRRGVRDIIAFCFEYVDKGVA